MKCQWALVQMFEAGPMVWVLEDSDIPQKLFYTREIIH
jgi:hypothetical protein